MARKKSEIVRTHKMNKYPGIEPRWDTSGREYRSFWVYDPSIKRNRRLPKAEVPFDVAFEQGPDGDKKALDFLKIKQSEWDSARLRIQKRLEWQTKFYDFEELLELFKKDMPKYSPRNWENNVYYIKHFVLPFFLTEKQTNNMNNWPLYYEEFKDWLAKLSPNKKGYGVTYALSTQNHVISALNSWMMTMKKRGKIETLEKCDKYPSHMLAVRGIEDVFTKEELSDVEEALKGIDPESYEFSVVLRDGGFRVSEAFGLSAADVCEGLPDEDTSDSGQIVRWIKTFGLETHGYIQLNSQVDDNMKIRSKDGKVSRVPLKHRKTMSPEDGRMIPIFSREFYDIVDRRIKRIEKEWEHGKYGGNAADYLLFDGLDYQKFTRSLALAYDLIEQRKKKKYKRKSPHCYRHTCSTWLAGKTLGTNQVCKLVLGHKDENTTERYVHFWKAIMREGQRKFQPTKRFAPGRGPKIGGC